MVFSQLGISKKRVVHRVLLQMDQLLMAYLPLLPYSSHGLPDPAQRRPFLKHQLSIYFFPSPKQCTLLLRKEQITPTSNLIVTSLSEQQQQKHKKVHFPVKPTVSRKFHHDRVVQPPLLGTLKEGGSGRPALSLYIPSVELKPQRHSSTSRHDHSGCSSSTPDQGMDYSFDSPNRGRFEPASKVWHPQLKICKSLREIMRLESIRVAEHNCWCRVGMYMILRYDGRRFSSSSDATAAQINPKGSDDENAKKLAKDEEEKANKKKALAEDHDQTVAQLAALKAQVKRVHEEMQARKSEAWAVKIRRTSTKIGNAFLKICPTVKAIVSMSRQDWQTKVAGWKKVFWLELQHYWVGAKLLWADIMISNRLLLKVATGKNLSRRERQQLKCTTADIFRLVPFAVILIVPFMELLLPLLLKTFPNMLPSTFQDKSKEQEQLNTKLVARIQYAKFLKEIVQDMARELKNSPSGELRRTAEDLDAFMHKVHTGGEVKNIEIIAFKKLFNDESTLDNISRPRLVSMCKYMNIQPYGTDNYLRFSLRNKLLRIKKDDRMIEKEGIDSLSEAELRSACRDRGMLGLRSVDQMRVQLRDWLDLSLIHNVPSSLLILSRAFLVAGKTGAYTAVEATLSSLPDKVIASVDVSAIATELELEERKRRLEFLQQQEDLIKAQTLCSPSA